VYAFNPWQGKLTTELEKFVDWKFDISRTIDFFLQELGEGLPRIISVLLRLALLYLFFWYLCAFSHEIWTATAVLLWSVVLVLVVWRLVRSVREFDLSKSADAGSWASYLYLNLLPIAAVYAATLCHCEFRTGLLHQTQEFLRKIPGIT
jgi:predicted PurR-regulated permease PerM